MSVLVPVQDGLADDNAYFEQMLELIPSSYYYPQESQANSNGKFVHAKGGKKAPSFKEESKAAKKARVQASQAKHAKKFDPDEHKTVVEVQRETESEEHISNQDGGSMDELRKRLHARIGMLNEKRTVEPTKAARRASLKKQKGKDTETNKKKKKEKKKKGKKAGGEDGEDKEDKKKAEKSQKRKRGEDEDGASTDLMFGAVKEVKMKAKAGEKEKNLSKKQLLKKVKLFEQKVEAVKAANPEQAEKMLVDKAVNASLLKLKGIKVKDDKKLLQKAIKRKEKEKLKSKIFWKGEVQKVKEHKEARGRIREMNLANRGKPRVGKSDKPADDETSSSTGAGAGSIKSENKSTRKTRKMQSKGTPVPGDKKGGDTKGSKKGGSKKGSKKR